MQGRYGEPIDPEGDINSMKKVLDLIKPGGILFLTVPIGPDAIIFNLHRRYGPIRLPLLIEGYEVIDRFAWQESKLVTPANWRQSYEPVFVLKSLRVNDGDSGVDVSVMKERGKEDSHDKTLMSIIQRNKEHLSQQQQHEL